MPTFAYDSSRLHPPGGSMADDETPPPLAREVADTFIAGPPAPRTQQLYNYDNLYQSFCSVIFGVSGEPHRLMFLTTMRRFRNQGSARALVTQVVSDFDHDQRDSTIIIRNVEPDCDVPRLQAFFESFGYVPTVLIPGEPDTPQLIRTAQPYTDPRSE